MGQHGKHRYLVKFWALLLGLCAGLVSPANALCRQALALGLDVSSSVDATEYALQIDGLAQALDDSDVRRALTGSGSGHVALLIYEWSGKNQQVIIQPWLEITSEDEVNQVIASLRNHPRSHDNFPTALGYAMGFGAIQFANSPNCFRRTLDISGDGLNNDGYRPKLAILNFDFATITVNGLVIAGDDADELTTYYQNEVIYGWGAFVEVAAGYSDYARAIKRKLLRELTVMAVSQLEGQ
ncbi:MAG: DUF1194 domain-containing protein [Rhodobacteraceae bacterium]|nr:DUF1194 domain-containing protein [Paracoccaceae bacterium]